MRRRSGNPRNWDEGGISGEPETLRALWCENPMNLKTVERRGTAGPESIGAEGELIPSREQSMSHGAAEEGEEDADKRMMMPNVTRRCGGLLGILSPQLDKRAAREHLRRVRLSGQKSPPRPDHAWLGLPLLLPYISGQPNGPPPRPSPHE